MSKVSVKFERTKNYDYAKGNPNRDDNTIYFPTNADCIVMSGKAYGLKDSSSVQQAQDAAAETAAISEMVTWRANHVSTVDE